MSMDTETFTTVTAMQMGKGQVVESVNYVDSQSEKVLEIEQRPNVPVMVRSIAPPVIERKKSFWNRLRRKNQGSKSMNDIHVEQDRMGRISTDSNWNVGFLMAVHERGDGYGFTEHIKQTAGIEQKMLCYGPYRSLSVAST